MFLIIVRRIWNFDGVPGKIKFAIPMLNGLYTVLKLPVEL